MEEIFEVLTEDGLFTGETADRDRCHKEGLWHRAVVVFVVNSNGQVLLQKRSAMKKLWPNLWDLTAGGHVLAGELGYQSAIRETEEEIGMHIEKTDMLYIGSVRSSAMRMDMLDNHFNDYFIVNKNVDISKLKLQKEEVQDIKWFDKEEITRRINNNYDGITDKIGLWEYLEKYLINTNL